MSDYAEVQVTLVDEGETTRGYKKLHSSDGGDKFENLAVTIVSAINGCLCDYYSAAPKDVILELLIYAGESGLLDSKDEVEDGLLETLCKVARKCRDYKSGGKQ